MGMLGVKVSASGSLSLFGTPVDMATTQSVTADTLPVRNFPGCNDLISVFFEHCGYLVVLLLVSALPSWAQVDWYFGGAVRSLCDGGSIAGRVVCKNVAGVASS